MSEFRDMIAVRSEHAHLLPKLVRLHAVARLVVETPRVDAFDNLTVLMDLLQELGIILDSRRNDPPGREYPHTDPQREQQYALGWAARWAWRWVYGADKCSSDWLGGGMHLSSNAYRHQDFMQMNFERLDGILPEHKRKKHRGRNHTGSYP